MRKRVPAVLVCIALSGAAHGASPEIELGADLRVVPVVPGVYRHVSHQDQEGWGRVPANGLIVVGSESAAMIDTPWTPDQTARLFDWVERELGLEVQHVVVTHSHDDCLGGLAEAHWRGAKSWALEMTAELAQADGDAIPRHTFSDRQTISLGTVDIVLRYFGGGHTRDNIVAWMPQSKVLFGGCLVRRVGATTGYFGEADLEAWPETIRRLMATVPDDAVVVPGHGRPGGREYLTYTLEFTEGLLSESPESGAQ